MKRAWKPQFMPKLTFKCEFHTIDSAPQSGDDYTQIVVGKFEKLNE